MITSRRSVIGCLVLLLAAGVTGAPARGQTTEACSGDCAAIVDGDVKLCYTKFNDCAAFVTQNKDLCFSNNCTALLSGEAQRCSSRDCFALVSRNSGECSSDGCEALFSRQTAHCPSDGWAALVSGNASLCPQRDLDCAALVELNNSGDRGNPSRLEVALYLLDLHLSLR